MANRLGLVVLARSLLLAAVVLSFWATLTHAASYQVLYSFGASSTDGANPNAGLIMDAGGNLYGTTEFGGANNKGTVFKLSSSGVLKELHSFAGKKDGEDPLGGLISDAHGNLYGTAAGGGKKNSGTVFRLSPKGKLKVLHSFAGSPKDGAFPDDAVVQDTAGNVFGTTSAGGAENFGAIFELPRKGKSRVLYSFTGSSDDGSQPVAELIQDAQGNLYGATAGNGSDKLGTIFEWSSSGIFMLLHSFVGSPSDGETPDGGLIRDADGDLFGTTHGGGTANLGTVFELPSGGALMLLHSFSGTADGAGPAAGLIMDTSGNLYGSAGGGGSNELGTVFELTSGGILMVLHNFAGFGDGANPEAGLIMDGAGNLYGTTLNGGAHGFGTVFKLTP